MTNCQTFWEVKALLPKLSSKSPTLTSTMHMLQALHAVCPIASVSVVPTSGNEAFSANTRQYQSINQSINQFIS